MVFLKHSRKRPRQLIGQTGYERLASQVWSWLTEHGPFEQSNEVLPEGYARCAWANLLSSVEKPSKGF